MITVKMYRRGPEVLVAACDIDILGKTFKSKDLKITVSEGFYKGDAGNEDLLVNRLEMATVANLVGRKCIKVAIDHGFVDPKCVLVIDGVPHAQIARMM